MSKTDLLDLDSVIEDFATVVEKESVISEEIHTTPEPSKMMVTLPDFSSKAKVMTLKEGVVLVDDPEKLFDFGKSKLNKQQKAYIIAFAMGGTKMAAAKAANVPYRAVFSWLADPEFREALQHANEIVTDCLEEELIKRAVTGSDKLLLEALKARNKEYQPKTQKNVNVSGEIVHTWSDLAKAAAVDVEYTSAEGDEEDGD